MKKLLSLLTLLLCFMLSAMTVNAQNVTVNPGAGSYGTLKDAFDAINAGTHTGAVTVSVVNNTTETAPAVLNASGSGSANYTSVIIRPTGDNIVVSGASASGRGIVELNGADNVTIDGDNVGSVGVNRNLTIQNTAVNSVTFTSVIRIATSASITNADNITIANCNIAGSGTGRNTSIYTSEVVTWGIVASINAGSPPTALTSATSTIASGQTVANLIINNNNIVSVSRGISCGGAATTVFAGLAISNNIVGSPTEGGVDQVYQNGITISGSSNGVISGNTVYVESYNITNSAIRGIEVGILSANTTTISIQRNLIGRVKNNNGATYGAYGINLGGGNGHVVVNNALLNHSNSQVAGTGAFSTTFGVFGIRVGSGTSHAILHNSVHFAGAIPGATSTDLVSCLAVVSTTSTGMDIRNNILSNVMTGGNTTLYNTVFTSLYLPSAGTSAMNLLLNNNAYYQSAISQSGIAQVSTTGNAANLYLSVNFNSGAITPSTNLRAYTSTLSAAGTNDNASFAFNTAAPFTSSTNLHIPFATPGPLESGGAFTSVTTDIDGNIRPGPAGSVNGGAFAPDIGYDEFDGIPGGDITPPVISYTALLNTNSVANRPFTGVTITDAASGVNGAPGTRPRVYYKRASDANTFNTNTSATAGWKYAEATGSTSPFDFVINYSLLSGGGGVSSGDQVQYFVVAQDLATIPNVGINSGTFAAQPSSVNLTSAAFPIGGSINGYFITGAPLAGDYTVGLLDFNRATGKNIELRPVVRKVKKEVPVLEETKVFNRDKNVTEDLTLGKAVNLDGKKEIREVEEVVYVPFENGTEFTGELYAPSITDDTRGVFATISAAVNSLNLNGQSAAVRFLLNDASYPSETLPIIIQNPTASSTNTLTIRPNTGVTATVSGTSSTGIFVIATPYVTIDGDNIGGATGRNLTINNTSTAANSYVVGVFNFGGAQRGNNATIKNTINIGGTYGTTNSWGIILNAAGGDFDNVVIDNNEIKKVRVAIQFAGVSGAVTENGTVTNNKIGDASDSNSVFLKGILCSFTDNTLISNNDIRGQVAGNATGAADPTAVNNGITLINSATNTTIRNNVIYDFYYNATTGYGAFGIVYALGGTTNTGTTNIYNNVMHSLKGDCDDTASAQANMGYITQGICVYTNGSAAVNIYYNSVYLSGDVLGAPFQGSSACIGVSGAVGAGSLNIRNNGLQNSQGQLNDSVEIKNHALGFWVAGAGTNAIFADINYNDYYVNGINPYIGYFVTSASTLSAWQTLTAKDANSKTGDPLFVSTTDLHIQSGSALLASGTPIAGITTDITGTARSVTTPTIGAYENPASSSSTLNLTIKMEGYTLMDTITVELRNSTSPYALVESVKGMGGLATSQPITFTSAVDGTPYAIVVKYRNGIATWSSGNVTFAGGVASYDFTTALSQAYASNQKLVSGTACIFQGDVNQSGGINLADITSIYNAATAFTSGYNVNNLINNSTVNLASITIAFNNASAFVVVKPRP